MQTRLALLVSAALTAMACNQATDSPAPGAGKGAKRETSTNGVITKGEPDGIKIVSNTALTKATNTPWVGMIPADDPASATCAETWSAIRMDDEDHNNANYIDYKRVSSRTITYEYTENNFSVGGLVHSSSPQRAGGNTWIHYCARQMNSLPSLAFDYAVISASNVCPSNSIRFTRRFDNEDGSNHNRYEGDITPNVSAATGSGYTILNFCFVPKAGTATWDPAFTGQIVLAPKGSNSNMYVDFFTDDEDDANNNQWSAASGTSTDIQNRMKAIVPAGGNSHLYGTTPAEFTTLDLGTATSCTNNTISRCTFSQPGDKSCATFQPLKEKYDKVMAWFCSF